MSELTLQPTEVYVYFKETQFKTWVNPFAALILYLEGKVDIVDVRGIEAEAFKKALQLINELKQTQPSEELKNMILEKNARFESSYWENRDKFDRLQALIYQAILQLVKHKKQAVSYDEIIDHIRKQHPEIKAETIARRIRELREEGNIIEPSRGRFYIRTLLKMEDMLDASRM